MMLTELSIIKLAEISNKLSHLHSKFWKRLLKKVIYIPNIGRVVQIMSPRT